MCFVTAASFYLIISILIILIISLLFLNFARAGAEALQASAPLSLSHTHTHTHTLSLSLSLTHTHTHTLSLSHTHTEAVEGTETPAELVVEGSYNALVPTVSGSYKRWRATKGVLMESSPSSGVLKESSPSSGPQTSHPSASSNPLQVSFASVVGLFCLCSRSLLPL